MNLSEIFWFYYHYDINVSKTKKAKILLYIYQLSGILYKKHSPFDCVIQNPFSNFGDSIND